MDVLCLPQALDTPLGPAQDLSGGQRQHLVVARALLTESEIVLLDEPSFQLDGISERRIAQAVDALAATRCVAGHRLSTVRNARHVIPLGEDGKFGRELAAGYAIAPVDRSPDRDPSIRWDRLGSRWRPGTCPARRQFGIPDTSVSRSRKSRSRRAPCSPETPRSSHSL
ncbi:ATP-binding cassette domain-containing protein [Streptomyces mirabilis]|uniref:ATP-binding cassette domain-containing protein n=1 Tax=Streptomyces mirabilis TaxID=68239 RepID=UPI0037F51573